MGCHPTIYEAERVGGVPTGMVGTELISNYVHPSETPVMAIWMRLGSVNRLDATKPERYSLHPPEQAPIWLRPLYESQFSLCSRCV